MPYCDLPLEELRAYTSTVADPDDFDEFWRATLEESRSSGRPPVLTRVDNRLTAVETWDITFAGFAGQPVRGWLHLPATRGEQPLPALAEFIGYTGGRGLPHERVTWALAGYAHFVMDTRGQGGDTDDEGARGHGSPSAPGFLTRGWQDPHSHYFRRLITDAALAVEMVRDLDGVDRTRVLTTGISQGGGLSIAAGVLSGAAAVLPDVPFLCDIPRASWIGASSPYTEIASFLNRRRDAAGTLMRTLSYVDAVNFARRASMPALFSVALMDPVCPPSTVYAAHNAWGGPKSIREWAYNGHEGGAAYQQVEQFDWLRDFLRG